MKVTGTFQQQYPFSLYEGENGEAEGQFEIELCDNGNDDTCTLLEFLHPGGASGDRDAAVKIMGEEELQRFEKIILNYFRNAVEDDPEAYMEEPERWEDDD